MKSRVSVFVLAPKEQHQHNRRSPDSSSITVNGKRFEVSADRIVHPDQWITGSNSVKSTKEEGRVLNTYLTDLETNVYKAINTIELSGKQVTLDAFKAIIKGTTEKAHTLISLFNYHNDRMKSLVGIDYANGTYKRYVVTPGKVKAFLLDKYKKQDIAISELNHAFIASSFIVVIFHSFSHHTAPDEVHTAA